MTTAIDLGALKGKRCLVLGASGFIGTNLSLRLTALGAHVVGFGGPSPFPNTQTDIKFVHGDFADSAALQPLVNDADIVFHLISTTTPTTSDRAPAVDVSANVVGTIRLLDQIRGTPKCTKVVFLSSGGTVYGPAAPVPTPEDYSGDPICSYGITRKTIEAYLSLYNHHYDLDYTVLRIANPYGPYQVAHGQGLVATLIERALKGEQIEIWGDGTVERDFVCIADVVDAICRAAISPETVPRIFNIGSGNSRAIRDVIAGVEVLHPQPLDITYRPGRNVDVPKSCLDISLAGTHLGWKPDTEWSQGLAETYTWMRNWLGRSSV